MKRKSTSRQKTPQTRPRSADDNMKAGNKRGGIFTEERSRAASDEAKTPRTRGKLVDK